jgi:hypothetical protein
MYLKVFQSCDLSICLATASLHEKKHAIQDYCLMIDDLSSQLVEVCSILGHCLDMNVAFRSNSISGTVGDSCSSCKSRSDLTSLVATPWSILRLESNFDNSRLY